MGALTPNEARSVWGLPGGNLTVIYSYSAEDAAPKTKRSAAVMPLLVILFIVSYGILTMLVFEQGQTIESQRSLIREMLKDSTQLAALKDKLARDQASVQADPKDAGSASQSNGVQSNSAPAVKGSDAKGSEKDSKRPSKSAHATKEIPGKPAADLEDVRRSTQVI
jgi:hypothetical protein